MGILKNVGGALAIAMVVCPAATSAQQLLDFAQFDYSADTRTLVLVRALRSEASSAPPPLLIATYTEWHTGSTAAIGYMHRWALTEGTHHWSVGAGAGANHFRSDDGREKESSLSLRAQTELSGPLPGGSYYALLQYSTFRDGTFGLIQYNLAGSPLGFELSRYSETEHRQSTVAVRYALDERRRWFARAGVTRSSGDNQFFVGVAFNAF
jgi:hypothetical protein